jgi:hypothetical protein
MSCENTMERLEQHVMALVLLQASNADEHRVFRRIRAARIADAPIDAFSVDSSLDDGRARARSDVPRALGERPP